MRQPSHRANGFTILEAALAAAMIAIAVASLFGLNSACLSLVRNAKESATAMLSNQQRIEQLRSCNWSQITDSAYITSSVMNTATQSGADISNATEVLRVTENGFLQGASAAYFEVTRAALGTSVTDSNSPSTVLGSRMLKVDVTLNWSTLGGRTRTRTTTSIIAKGGLTINETTTIAPTLTW
jgi:Tfp pilus assembly protein PilV